MRKSKRFLAGALASLMAVSAMTGCGSGTGSGEPNTTSAAGQTQGEQSAAEKEEPIEMSWLRGQTNSEVDDNAEVVKMIEERFNIDLKGWQVDSANYAENLSVRFAAGEMPDVLTIGNTGDLPTYVEGGIIAELPIELIREKAPHYAAAADKYDDGTLWTTMIYNGKNYGVANPLKVYPFAMIWRKDWLDKLGLEVPTTLEEYEDVLTAFVEQDPDGNGKKDTAAMAERAFACVFGAYGLRVTSDSAPGFLVEEMQLGEDGVPFFPYIRPEAKEALTVLHDWYEKGIVDKEFITGENHGGYEWLSHSFMNGRIGLTSAQPTHYLAGSTDTADEANWAICMQELKALNPEADIVFGSAPIGPEGKSGTEAWGMNGMLTCLTTKGAEDPRKVDTFLEMLDAYYADMDYAKLVNYGIEGVHYEETENGPRRLIDGVEVRKEGVLQVDFGNTVPYVESVKKKSNDFCESVTGNAYYRFNVPPVSEFSDVIATLDTLTEQAYFDMITGAKPIDYFDTFVEEFKKAGGEQAEKAVQEAFAEKLSAVQ